MQAPLDGANMFFFLIFPALFSKFLLFFNLRFLSFFLVFARLRSFLFVFFSSFFTLGQVERYTSVLVGRDTNVFEIVKLISLRAHF